MLCFVPDCDHYSARSSCRFFRFPKEMKERHNWLRYIRRADKFPSPSARVCSCHFLKGNRENGPTIFATVRKNVVTEPLDNGKGPGTSADTEGITNPVIVLFPRAEATNPDPEDMQEENIINQESPEDMDEAEPAEISHEEEDCRATSCTETIGIQTEGGLYEALLPEITKLQSDKMLLEEQLELYKLSVTSVTDEKTMHKLTGLNSASFQEICLRLDIDTPYKQDFFILLIKLKNGICNEVLAFMFRLSYSNLNRKVNSMIDLLYNKITAIIEGFKVKKFSNVEALPEQFQEYLPKCKVIIDSVEFRTSKSETGDKQQSFSEKFDCCTVKCLLGFTPSGTISFISDVCGGSISDEELLLQSGIFNYLSKTGAAVLDMNLAIDEDVENTGVSLYPAEYLTDKLKFHILEQNGRKYSKKSIAFPRVVSNFAKYKYFNQSISSTSLQFVHKIITIVAFIANFD